MTTGRLGGSRTRRRLLAALGAGNVVGHAGCIGSEEGGETTADGGIESTPDGPETDTPSPDAQTTESGDAETLTDATTATQSPAGRTTTVSERSWPMFQVDAANTGHHPTAAGPTDDVEGRWQFETGATVTASPIVVYVGSADGNLYALDATSSTEEWRFDAERDVEHAATVDEDGELAFEGSRPREGDQLSLPDWLPWAGGAGALSLGVGVYKYLNGSEIGGDEGGPDG